MPVRSQERKSSSSASPRATLLTVQTRPCRSVTVVRFSIGLTLYYVFNEEGMKAESRCWPPAFLIFQRQNAA